MNKQAIKHLVTAHLSPLDEFGGGKGYRVFHSINVADISLRIAHQEKLEIDEDALYLAAISHDLRKDEVVRFGLVIYSLERYIDIDSMTPEYLQQFYATQNFDIKFLEKVAKIITQKPHTQHDYIESSVISDADELVNFGYLSVWRQFTNQAYLKHTMLDAIENWINIDKPKQLKLLSELKFQFSKDLAQERITRCDAFFGILQKEIQNTDTN